jgi:hypothetical protein
MADIAALQHVMRLTNSYLVVASFTLFNACAASETAPVREPEAPTKIAKTKRKKNIAALDPARIIIAMRTNELDVRKCFFRAPTSRGFVRLGWRVDKSGSVQDVEIERSTINNEAVEDCLKEKVSELRFGDIESESMAHWTYAFRVASPPPDDERAKQKPGKKKAKSRSDEPGVSIEKTSPGTLDPDKIDNVVQSGFPLFAHCFRDGVGRDSRLAGTVRLRFIINDAGAVSKVLDGESDLPDKMMIDCVAEGFYALQFPKPEGGAVHVMYRVEFE